MKAGLVRLATAALALACVAATPVQGQTATEVALEAIAEDMRQWDELLRERGFAWVGEAMTGGAAEGEHDDHAVQLTAGVEYRIVAACDQDCTDVDLILLDGSGNVVTSDVETDADPVVAITPPSTADYTVRVAIVTCSVAPCLHAARLYQAGAAAQVASATSGRVIDERGTLASGDEELNGGEYVDRFEVQATAGQTLVADMVSTDFDTYLFVRGPNGDQEDNDDHEGNSSRSRLEVQITESGTWRVSATSYAGGETGDYRLTVDLNGAGSAASAVSSTGTRNESGELRSGDQTLDSGEYYDSYSFMGTAGEQVVIDLRSTEVDPYLILMAPSSESEQNDDFEGSAERSVISTTLEETGEYTVVVTTYAPNESGSYDLQITQGGGETGVRSEQGALASGDETLSSGEYADVYRIQATPGQQLVATVSSSDFDTYLMVIGPDSDRKENDDLAGRPGESEVEMTLAESGEYRVVVTSYEPGETGNYSLSISQGATAQSAQASRDVTELSIGSRASGRLQEGDGTLSGGEYRDMYVFEGTAGQTVSVAMRSQSFDTYVGLITPSGEQVDNDDWEGDTRLSRVDHVLAETGRYRVMATSYQAGEQGDYEVEVTRAGADATAVANADVGLGPAQIYGVFVGISDYGGRASDLSFTAEDAERVSQALQATGAMSADNAVVLTDSRATRANVEQAVREIGARAGPDDMFVFFYSGHGAQVPRDAPQPSDPDALDETLEFYDTRITDDEFAALLSEIAPGVALIALDACYSGGFSKDVVSVPGRMGLFSSEEDVISAVAAKFRAGGYLSQFFADGVGRRLADLNGDRTTSALELSQYLHNRYRADVESSTGDDYVRTGGPQLGYQHLVVDRGSIRSSEVLFR